MASFTLSAWFVEQWESGVTAPLSTMTATGSRAVTGDPALTPLAAAMGAIGTALLLAVLAGLLVRGHWRSWYFFALYVAGAAGFALLVVVDPGRFHVEHWWMVQENTINAIRLGMALELAARTFRGFPGARSTLQFVILLVAAAVFALVLPGQLATDYRTFLGVGQPRLLNGTVWLFTAISAAILWYRLPVLPFRKAILLSFVPYLMFSTVFLNALTALGWADPREHLLGYLNQAFYLAVCIHWTRVAWQTSPAADASGPAPMDRPAHT
jgi:hypothetical protein